MRRINEARVQYMIQDIQREGQREPILVAADGTIIDGAHRAEACKRLGIPVKKVMLNETGMAGTLLG